MIILNNVAVIEEKMIKMIKLQDDPLYKKNDKKSKKVLKQKLDDIIYLEKSGW
jgi:transcriptional regulator of NAD metabolism